MPNVKKQKTSEYPYTDIIRIDGIENNPDITIDILYCKNRVHISLFDRTTKRCEHF